MVFGVSMALGAFLAGHGGRPLGLQPAGGRRRRCRCATPSRCCSSCPSACCFDPAAPARRRRAWSPARWPSSCSASRWRRWSSCCSCGYPLRIGARGGGRAGADRRVLVHPRRRWRTSWASSRPTATNALVAAAIVSITLNPLLFRAIGPIDRWLARRQRRPVMTVESALDPSPATHRAVVVGYGPVGRTLARLLRRTTSRRRSSR